MMLLKYYLNSEVLHIIWDFKFLIFCIEFFLNYIFNNLFLNSLNYR